MKWNVSVINILESFWCNLVNIYGWYYFWFSKLGPIQFICHSLPGDFYLCVTWPVFLDLVVAGVAVHDNMITKTQFHFGERVDWRSVVLIIRVFVPDMALPFWSRAFNPSFKRLTLRHISASPIWQRACCSLLTYLVVPLNVKSLTLILPSFPSRRLVLKVFWPHYFAALNPRLTLIEKLVTFFYKDFSDLD